MVAYLIGLLRQSCEAMGLPFDTIRSSELAIDGALHGQDRILAIAEALGATRYVNLQGGRTLYDPARFIGRGIDLSILEDWRGSLRSAAERLLTESAAPIPE